MEGQSKGIRSYSLKCRDVCENTNISLDSHESDGT